MPSYQPDADHLLLFDGVCHLCDGTVKLLLSLDREAQLKFAPIQSALGQRLYREQGLDPESPHTMLLVTPRGAFQASDAVLELARVLGWPWRLAAALKLVPRAVRDVAYHFIAQRRYAWFGREEACLLPSPELRARLLDD